MEIFFKYFLSGIHPLMMKSGRINEEFEFPILQSQRARVADLQKLYRAVYGQDLLVSVPVSVSTAFAMSNLATFMKEPLYKLTPRRGKERVERQREIQRSPHPPSPSPSHPPPHSHSHLLVISISMIGNIVRIFDIVIEFIYTIFSIF
jgi:hypothetical protein